MRIAILGGTQFIGRRIAERLAVDGHRLLLVHRGEHEPADLPEAEHAHVDRHDTEALAAAVKPFGAEAVVDVSGMNASAADAAIHAFGETRVVAISSGDVYRAYQALHEHWTSDPVPLAEDAPLRSRRHIDGPDYENLELEERYLPRGATVLRLAAVYGEHDYQRRFDFVLRRLRAGRGRIPIGSGTFLFSRVYVGDVASAVALALEGQHRGEAFNIAERMTASYRLFAEQILELAQVELARIDPDTVDLGHIDPARLNPVRVALARSHRAAAEAELVSVPDDGLPDDLEITGTISQHLQMDAAKAREVLGWSESDPVEALRRSIRWHLENPPDDPDPDFAADDAALAAPL